MVRACQKEEIRSLQSKSARMSSLILISGSISEARDPLGRFDPSDVFYTFIEEDPDDPESVVIRQEDLPMGVDSKRFEIIQDLGSGKTLKAMDILGRKVFSGGACYANLGLAWNPANEGKPKSEWIADINSLDDLSAFNNCTILIDDIYGTIQSWNSDPAKVVSLVANERRKLKKDIIITAQREVMIPPGLRDMATEWIVPVITVRDFTKETPDDTGYPLELRTIHFNGAKVFKYVSPPLIGLERLFEAYNTIERAVHLQQGEDKARTNQPGYALEVKALDFLKINIPGMKWDHLNGKHEYDIISDTHAIDVVGTDPDGRLILEHKDLLKHIRIAKRKGQTPYLMFESGGNWRFVKITPHVNHLIEGKRIDPDKFGNNLSKKINSIQIS